MKRIIFALVLVAVTTIPSFAFEGTGQKNMANIREWYHAMTGNSKGGYIDAVVYTMGTIDTLASAGIIDVERTKDFSYVDYSDRLKAWIKKDPSILDGNDDILTPTFFILILESEGLLNSPGVIKQSFEIQYKE
jgi:hypothetical protein